MNIKAKIANLTQFSPNLPHIMLIRGKTLGETYEL